MVVYKKWLITTIVLVFVIGMSPFLFIAGFNYFIDPLWNFNHSHKYNRIQQSFDERLQKTNFITHNKFEYDTLIIGSSRTTYINQYDLVGKKAYNYAVSNMFITEYTDYIEYAKKQNGKDFDFIIMELYFGVFSQNGVGGLHEADYYFARSNETFSRYKSLFSFDTWEKSKINFKSSRENKLLFSGDRSYNRENIASVRKTSYSEIEDKFKYYLSIMEQPNYTSYSQKGSNYKDILSEIKKNNPNTTFIVFTDPLMAPRFKTEIGSNWEAYERWIRESVNIFGSIYNFMYANSVTNEISNYFDPVHFYPEIGTLIAHRLVNYPDPKVPKDFGFLVTNENIEHHLKEVKWQLK